MPRAKSKRPSRVETSSGSGAAQYEPTNVLPPPRKRFGKRKHFASSILPPQTLTVFKSVQDLVSAARLRDGVLLGKFPVVSRVCTFFRAELPVLSCNTSAFQCACEAAPERGQAGGGVASFTFIASQATAKRLCLDAGKTFLHIDRQQLKSVVGDSLTSFTVCEDILRLCEAGYLRLAVVVATPWELVLEATPHIFHCFNTQFSADDLVPPIRRRSSEQLARVLRTIQPVREDIQLLRGGMTSTTQRRRHPAMALPAFHNCEDNSPNHKPSDRRHTLKGSLVDQLLCALTPEYISHQHRASSVATSSSGELQEAWGAKLLNRLPDFFLPRLRPYQLRGLDWMMKRERHPSPVGLELFDSSSTWVRWNAIPAGSGNSLAYNLFNGALCVVRCEDDQSGRPTASESVVHHASKIPISSLPEPSVIAGCGGILADEMGLGKTVIFIALMALDRNNKKPWICFDVRTPNDNIGTNSETGSGAETAKLQPSTTSTANNVVNNLPAKNYASMPIAEIAQLLRDRHLQTTGGKEAMMRRLIAADSTKQTCTGSSSRANYICLCGKGDAPQCAWVSCRRCHQRVHSVCIGLTVTSPPHGVVQSSANNAADEYCGNSAAAEASAAHVSDQRTPLCFTCRSVVFETARLPRTQHEEAPTRGEKRLSFSTVVADSLVPSAATLIVCPDALIAQWMAEIRRHTTENTFRVVVYEGIKAIAKTARARPLGGDASSNWPQKAKLLDPRSVRLYSFA